MQLVKAWLYGYYKPLKMIEILKSQSTPLLGFYATLIRGLLNSLLLFLPLYLLNKQPSMPSFLTFVSAEKYFLFLTYVAPLFFIFLWIVLCGILYLILKIARQPVNIDHLLNISGLIGLIVGFFIVLWDWVWVLLQSKNYTMLGISHLIIDIGAIALSVICLNKIIGLKIWLGILLNILWILLGIPLAVLIMRAPL